MPLRTLAALIALPLGTLAAQGVPAVRPSGAPLCGLAPVPRSRLCLSFAPFLWGMLAGLAVTARPAGAQDRPGVSLDLTVGAGGSVGHGEFRSRGGLALDVAATRGVSPGPGGAWLAGVAGSAQGAIASGYGGCCRLPFPVLYSATALGGREWRASRGRSARLLAGPAYVWSEDQGGTLGLQARMDVSIRALARLALVGSARAGVLPRFLGGAQALGAVGIGLRIQ